MNGLLNGINSIENGIIKKPLYKTGVFNCVWELQISPSLLGKVGMRLQGNLFFGHHFAEVY